MEFNRFLWSTYKESESGKKIYSFFKDYRSVFIKRKKYTFYKQLRESIAYKGTLKIDFPDYVKALCEAYASFCRDENNKQIIFSINSIEEAEDFFTELIQESEDEPTILPDDIPFLSEVLFAVAPRYFFPYYFEKLYQDIIEICNTFGIFLPTVPKKNDKQGRLFHYFELCRSLYQFRITNNLDEYDLPLFLYGFAINIIKRYKVSEELPKPRKAYFVGAGKKDDSVDSSGDFEYLDNISEQTISVWNGNPDTQTGDIIVMYCLSPRRYIHSI